MRSTELWCAIAHLRISRFRVWSFGPSRNDGGESHIHQQIRQQRLIQFSNSPGYTSAFSRRHQRPSLAKSCPSKDRGRREDRVPATAPTAPAQKRLRERALTTGERGNHSGLPCAVVLRLIRALLGEPSRLPPSPSRSLSASLGLSARSLGRQNHTTSPYASPPLVERHLYVHRIPARVRDDRDTPLDSGLEQNGNIREDLVRVKRARTSL